MGKVCTTIINITVNFPYSLTIVVSVFIDFIF